MKFCIRYYWGLNALKEADEVIISYKHRTTGLFDYIQNNIKEVKVPQRIIIALNEYEDDDLESNIDIFKGAFNISQDIAILLTLQQRDLIEPLKEAGIPFFFNERCNTIDMVNGFIAAGVSDVYITDELCFKIKDVGKMCRANKVKVRVYPNVAQSSSPYTVDSITKFFIRPEDVAVYENCIDVFELFGPLKLQDAIYNIYKKRAWAFDLSILIAGLEEGVHNTSFLPHFGQKRSRCGKKCAYGRECSICYRLKALSDTLYDKELDVHYTYELSENEKRRQEQLRDKFIKEIRELANREETDIGGVKADNEDGAGVPAELLDPATIQP